MSYLKAQARATGVPLATLAAKTFVAKIDELLSQHKSMVKLKLFLTPDRQVRDVNFVESSVGPCPSKVNLNHKNIRLAYVLMYRL